MTDKQIIKLNELTEMSQELGLYEDRPDWRITLQADHIKRLEEELQAKEQECEELKKNYFTVIQQRNKAELTLTEIKEIAEKILKMIDYKTYFKRDNKSIKQEGFKALDKILQKISEVINE